MTLPHKGSHFDTKRNTKIITDWSKKGIGFLVMQRCCNCSSSIPPTCCKNGWKLAFCNKRYLTTTESNYSPIKAKALVVALTLKKARLFLLSCKHFTVIVENKPLV